MKTLTKARTKILFYFGPPVLFAVKRFVQKIANFKVMFFLAGSAALFFLYINATSFSNASSALNLAKEDPVFREYYEDPSLIVASQQDADKLNAITNLISVGLAKDFANSGSQLKVSNTVYYQPGDTAKNAGMIYIGLNKSSIVDSKNGAGQIATELSLGIQTRVSVIPSAGVGGSAQPLTVRDLSKVDSSIFGAAINWLSNSDGSVLRPVMTVSSSELGTSDLWLGELIRHEDFHIYSTLDEMNGNFNLGNGIFSGFRVGPDSFRFKDSGLSIYTTHNGYYFDEVPARLAQAGFLVGAAGNTAEPLDFNQVSSMDDMFTGTLQLLNNLDPNSGVYNSHTKSTLFFEYGGDGKKGVNLTLPGDRRTTANEDFDLMRAQCIYGTQITRDVIVKYIERKGIEKFKILSILDKKQEVYFVPRFPASALKKDSDGITNIDPNQILQTKKGLDFYDELNTLTPGNGKAFKEGLYAAIASASGSPNVGKAILDFALNPTFTKSNVSLSGNGGGPAASEPNSNPGADKNVNQNSSGINLPDPVAGIGNSPSVYGGSEMPATWTSSAKVPTVTSQGTDEVEYPFTCTSSSCFVYKADGSKLADKSGLPISFPLDPGAAAKGILFPKGMDYNVSASGMVAVTNPDGSVSIVRTLPNGTLNQWSQLSSGKTIYSQDIYKNGGSISASNSGNAKTSNIPNSNTLGQGTKTTVANGQKESKTGAVTALPKMVFGEPVD